MASGSCWVTTLPTTQPFPYPELADFASTALLESPRVLVLGDFNIHAEAEISGPALEFLETMASFDMSQHVNGPTHVGGHMWDLVFSNEQSLLRWPAMLASFCLHVTKRQCVPPGSLQNAAKVVRTWGSSPPPGVPSPTSQSWGGTGVCPDRRSSL